LHASVAVTDALLVPLGVVAVQISAPCQPAGVFVPTRFVKVEAPDGVLTQTMLVIGNAVLQLVLPRKTATTSVSVVVNVDDVTAEEAPLACPVARKVTVGGVAHAVATPSQRMSARRFTTER
jgi:hypothetical protein